MARPIWCRFCGALNTVVAGVFPAKCANEVCGEVGFWSTQPVERAISDRKKAKQPRVPFDLTHNDRKLLKSLRILQE